MPDTKRWNLLVDDGHREPPPLDIGTIDQCQAALDECAKQFGFTLTDRATVESAILGSAAGNYMQARIGRAEIGRSAAFDRELAVSSSLVRWLLIQRLHRMEGT